MIDQALAIFCMTSTHKLLIETLFHNTCPHVCLMREFLSGEVDKEIPDPYGQDRLAYEAARDAMVEAIPSLLKFLRQHYPAAKKK
jgi:protein-tyrosine-phosphatase